MAVAPEPMFGCLQASIGSSIYSMSFEPALELFVVDSSLLRRRQCFVLPSVNSVAFCFDFSIGSACSATDGSSPRVHTGLLAGECGLKPLNVLRVMTWIRDLLTASLMFPLLMTSVMISYGKILRLLLSDGT